MACAALIASGCSIGGNSIPKGAICTVDGEAVTRAAFDRRVATLPKGPAGMGDTIKPGAKATAAEKEFAEKSQAGATKAEKRLQKVSVVDALVQDRILASAPETLDVTVSDAAVDKRVKKLRDDLFGGDKKRFKEGLRQQGTTEKKLRKTIREQMLKDELYAHVTRNAKVSTAEAQAYYDKHKASYGKGQERDIQQILIPAAKGSLAASLATELRGADSAAFTKAARANSIDRETAAQGGARTVTKGQMAAVLETPAFSLDDGAVSAPVETPLGWYIIRAAGPVEQPTYSFKEVREQISAMLLEQEKSAAMERTIAKLRKDADVTCRKGYDWNAVNKTRLRPAPTLEKPPEL